MQPFPETVLSSALGVAKKSVARERGATAELINQIN